VGVDQPSSAAPRPVSIRKRCDPDVVVTTTVDAWFRFITHTPNEQTARGNGVDIDRRSGGRPLGPLTRRTQRLTTRYAAPRIAWHVLEHAWEMQDRAESQVVQPGQTSPAS
jgi:hypothetical protein